MIRVTSIWSGFAGSPGYTNFYFGAEGLDGIITTATEAAACVNRTRTFWAAIAALYLPSAVKIDVSPSVANLDAVTGEMEDEFTVAAPAQVVGGGSGTFASPAGLSIAWRTSAIIGGRRLRGRSFIVPVPSSAFDSDGTLKATAVTDVTAAANTLRGAALGLGEQLVVWKRPKNQVGGQNSAVSSCSVPDKPAILRSRRP